MLILTDKTDGSRAVEIFGEANKNKLQLFQIWNPIVPIT